MCSSASPMRLLLIALTLCATYADLCAAPLVVDGQAYDLSPLAGALRFTAANGWAFHFSACARMYGAALAPIAKCPGYALAYQITEGGSCFALAGYRSGARQAAPGGQGLVLDLRGGDSCDSVLRRVHVTLICSADASTLDSVEESCGKCCYTMVVRSPAGCAAACPVDAASGLVCSGATRGECSRAAGAPAICVCHPGFSGATCLQSSVLPAAGAATSPPPHPAAPPPWELPWLPATQLVFIVVLAALCNRRTKRMSLGGCGLIAFLLAVLLLALLALQPPFFPRPVPHAPCAKLAAGDLSEEGSAASGQLTLAITSFHSVARVISSLPEHLAQPLVGEVVVAVDGADGDDANALREWLDTPTTGISRAAARRVRVYPTSIQHGALRNKVRAVQLASLDWVALVDADNIVGDGFFGAAAAHWASRYNASEPPALPAAFKEVLLPERLVSTTLDYSSLRRAVGDVNARSWDALRAQKLASALLNTGNYILHKTVLSAWEPLAREGVEPFGMDVLVMNKRLVEAGFTLAVVEGMSYYHHTHPGSLWASTEEASMKFLREFKWELLA